MKKWILPAIAILMIVTLIAAEISREDSSLKMVILKSLTGGNAAFTVRTVSYNGPYAPNNAGVIWVTDSNNQFVKTIKVWASSYRYTLVRWIASSSQNTTGAITSASYTSHQLHQVNWNGKNWQNVDMPDGDYKFNVEFTEHNASVSNMGKYKQMTFTKGSDPVNLTLPNESFFQNLSVNWAPEIVNGTISGIVTNGNGNSIANATLTAGSYSAVSNAIGFFSISAPPGTYNITCTAAGYEQIIINNIQVLSSQTTTVNVSLASVSNADYEDQIPQVIFSPVYPNPGKDKSLFRFYTENPADYILSVFNAKGQLVKRVNGRSKQGWQETEWDGRSSSGYKSPAGVYAVRFDYKGKTVYRQFTLLR